MWHVQSLLSTSTSLSSPSTVHQRKTTRTDRCTLHWWNDIRPTCKQTGYIIDKHLRQSSPTEAVQNNKVPNRQAFTHKAITTWLRFKDYTTRSVGEEVGILVYGVQSSHWHNSPWQHPAVPLRCWDASSPWHQNADYPQQKITWLILILNKQQHDITQTEEETSPRVIWPKLLCNR